MELNEYTYADATKYAVRVVLLSGGFAGGGALLKHLGTNADTENIAVHQKHLNEYEQEQRSTGKKTKEIMIENTAHNLPPGTKFKAQVPYETLIQQENKIINNIKEDSSLIVPAIGGVLCGLLLVCVHELVRNVNKRFDKFYDNVGDTLFTKLHPKKAASRIYPGD